MTVWVTTEAKDLCSDIVDCVNKTAPVVDYPTPFKMIRTPNVRDGWVDTVNVRYVEEGTFERWTRRLRPRRGDVILTREAPLGEVGILRSDDSIMLGQRLVMYRTNPDVCDAEFLAYAMLGPEVQASLRRLGSGATVEHLRVPDCSSLAISVPPLSTQKRVAGVLGALDSLIENNRRRVELLEDMARAIYREWFVHFRHPGHEGDTLVDSLLGSIPDGWAAVRLDQLVSTQYGYTESASATPVGPRYLRGMDINKTSYIDWTDVPFCPITDRERKKFAVLPGDVFVIRMADPGKVGICEADVDAVFASYLVRLRPLDERIRSYFLYFTLAADGYQGWVTGASTGATRKSVSAKVMTEPLIVLPPTPVQSAFDDTVVPLRSLISRLLEENARLRSMRDLLLPRLVTGRIDVSSLDLDALVEQVAE